MKTARFKISRFCFVLLTAFAVAILAVPTYSVVSGALGVNARLDKASAGVSKVVAPESNKVLSNLNWLSRMTAAAPLVETIETFAADCSTPKITFTLGETVCIGTSGGAGQSRVQLVNPAGYVYARENVDTDPDTISFTLPTDTTFAGGGSNLDGSPFTFDNRGPWRATLVDNPSAGVRFSVPITVRDPQQNVANLQVVKTLTNTGAPTAGSNIQALVRVFNGGPDSATNVQFTDVLPANTTFVSLTQTGGPTFNCTTPAVGGTGTSVCTLASLAVNTPADFVAVYMVNGNVGNAANLDTSASATSTTTETSSADNSSSDSASASNPAPPSCTLSCPGNITTTAAMGQSGATVNFSAPTTGGTCGSVSVVPASGSFFAVGTSVVTASTENGETCSFTVTVNPAEDNEAPVISCPSDITVDESSSSANSANVSYSVTATDNSGSSTVTCNPPSGSSFAVGTTPVTCVAEDAAGNTDTCTFNVTVNQVGCDLDANSPPPTPNNASLPTITAACTVTLLTSNDPSATDACGGTISGDTTDPREYDQPGTYTVNWAYTDSAGHTTTQQQTIVISPDNSAPVPNAANLPTVTGECEVELTAPTATDNCAGTVTGTTPNMTISGAGTHTVVWTYDDGRGNTSTQNQTVVITDTAAPVLTLTGPSTVTVECHTSYTDAGATATDNCSPAPTPTSTSNVDVNTPGTYQVVWTATDAGGNTDSETRTVTVVDTTAPVITLTGASTMTVECHTAFTDPGASAADSCDTSVPVNVAGSVNADAVGTYTLTYTASDDTGNAATSVTRTVNVVDTTAPAVALNGAATMTVILGSSFTDPGATANDSCTGSLAVTVTGSVNTNAVGSYTLTYAATDASNNTGTATRTVNVIYNFSGFFSPVANAPVLNSVNAGRAIPVKFSLAGDQGLNIFAAGNPYTVSLNCSTNDPGVDVSETLSAGGSSLSYSGGQYIYVWKTESSWAGTCRQLVITLNDGTVHIANFKFK